MSRIEESTNSLCLTWTPALIEYSAVTEIPGLESLESLRTLELNKLNQLGKLDDLSGLKKLMAFLLHHCGNPVD